uniref:Glycosyltransferase RgtA/B/C/D-like domain-containing protein n=1 Tax=Solibacter usitatus (strain Ellin6076) TaxID=234267 RepID=Q01PY2_SOLUE
MIDPLALLSLAIAVALGYFGVSLWVPNAGGPLLRASLGAALGMGSTSSLYLLLVIAGTPTLPVVVGLEVVALVVLAAVSLRRNATPGAASPPLPAFSFTWILAGAALLMVALFLSTFLTASELNPQGGWDAFAIWNLRAHYLLHSQTWRFAVTAQPMGSHMEYPLLLSSFVARGWLYAGTPSASVPIAIALVVALGLAALVGSTLSTLRSPAVGLLAVLILLANPVLWSAAPDQYADLPLAFFALAAAALLVLDRDPRGSPRYLTLAGLFASFAAGTKNEGTLLLAALTAALLATAWRGAGIRQASRRIGFLLLGALPLLCLTLWIKIFAAPPDPLVSGMGKSFLQNIGDAGRWLHIAVGFLQGLPAIPLTLLVLTAALLRPRPAADRTPIYFLPLAAFAILLAGDFAVFLLSPDETSWLLATALARLYLQLWPLIVLSAFLLLRRPEDFALAGPAPETKSKKARRSSVKAN